MRHILFRLLRVLSGVAALFALSQSHAVLIYALHQNDAFAQQIVSFRSDTTTIIRSVATVDGLASGERLVGLSFRPETGQLFSMVLSSSSARLVTVDPFNGDIRQVDTTSFAYVFGDNISYNPVNDRIRFFSWANDGTFITGNKNLSISFGGGTPVTHTDLKYVPGDPAFGAIPLIDGALAHNYPHSDALTTTLYGIDTDRNTLVRVGNIDDTTSANGGDVATIGSLGIDISEASMAITPRLNVAFASFGYAGASLYRINLNTGAATLVGAIGTPSGSTTARITAIAIPDQNKCFDLDGNGRIESTSDGLMLLRTILGFTGTSVTANAIPPGPHPIGSTPIRTTWIGVRNHLNQACGMDFAP